MVWIIFQKMKQMIHTKVENAQPGLYAALLFPITFSFLLTFIISRLFAYFASGVYLEISPGLHIHHFTYGIFILAISGYLAMIFDSARAKFWTALLFGMGLGLAFDEFGMWLRLRDDDVTRLEYDGFSLVLGLVVFLLTFRQGIRLLKRLWPF